MIGYTPISLTLNLGTTYTSHHWKVVPTASNLTTSKIVKKVLPGLKRYWDSHNWGFEVDTFEPLEGFGIMG